MRIRTGSGKGDWLDAGPASAMDPQGYFAGATLHNAIPPTFATVRRPTIQPRGRERGTYISPATLSLAMLVIATTTRTRHRRLAKTVIAYRSLTLAADALSMTPEQLRALLHYAADNPRQQTLAEIRRTRSVASRTRWDRAA